MLFAIGQLIAGAALLLIGGEGVVRGASRLAMLAKLSPLFIGLTVVSLGTSAPEMAVSVSTAMKGQADITIGNVVGSNLFNMLMIVGVSAACLPLPVEKQITRFDVPVMLGATVLMWVLGLSGSLSRIDSVIFLTCLLVYFIVSFRLGKQKGSSAVDDELRDLTNSISQESTTLGLIRGLIINMLILIAGIAALILGCEWFVAASVYFARIFGLSEVVIGLTIVSAGTSLPELVTSVAATLKGQRGIAIGNAVGSTTLNVLAVLGVTALAAPSGVAFDQSVLWVDAPIMIAVAAFSWLLFRTGHVIKRWEGGLLVLVYIGYIVYLLKRNNAF
ncbi:MAG: calcium/sodium antiporter [Planctomycetota bacterium]